MVDYPALEGCEPGGFDRAAQEAGELAQNVESMIDELEALVPVLSGADDDFATVNAIRDRVAAETDRLREAQLSLRTIETSLLSLGEDVRRGRMELEEARRRADKFAKVDYSLGVITLDFGKVPQADADPKGFARFKAQLRDVADQMRRAHTLANTSDYDAASDIAKKSPALTEPGPSRIRSPYENHSWWTGRSAAEREHRIETEPNLVGGPDSDGIPSAARSAANEQLLRQHIRELEERAASGSGAASRLLAVMLAVQHRLADDASDGTRERAFLLLAEPSDPGRIVLAIGNPDIADHVIVHIPGTGASLPKLAGEIARVERMVGDANLYETRHTAGILWLGYDAPPNLFAAATKRYAQSATKPLPRFLTGIRAVRRRGLDRFGVTVMGHSYGTVAIGFTVREQQVSASQLILVASPGVGVKSADQLKIDKDDVYATTAPNDIIHRVPRVPHGTSPVHKSFGAKVFPTPHHNGSQIAAHSAYWKNDNPVRQDFAAIITGHGHKVVGGTDADVRIQPGPWTNDEGGE
ncbi:alpha/beta hydrolase [Stackebrandtia nassauensis]|uniref:DUF1023 domain-containing protein n=1 Tax=Stackebrandtia nassauensis (strain DSM 44728 / CIP 108903 / NRRL B-16338 / NBRC 102104 / LLR-40K-21) TaxID=446470 RepID=D3Q8K0_STANL|nr:alpha/beta hydrolase [Stackebrandtia nassauensis]ADD44442.1 protein of unknown function DUF1023 [Stackebrandtia nassauensis DSM 44728]